MIRPGMLYLEEFGLTIDRRLDALTRGQSPPACFEETAVLEFADRYELRLWASCLDPRQTEVEAEPRRLTVRVNLGRSHSYESVFTFAQPVEVESVEAHWSKGLLTVVLPKLGTQRVLLEES